MQITVLQWNTWYREDIRNVAEFLRAHPVDIVCLQELTLHNPAQITANCPEWLAAKLGMNVYYKDIPIENIDGTKEAYANAILSQHPLNATSFTWINEPKTGGGYNDEFRAYVEATVECNGIPVTMGTTHMSYTHKFEGTPARQAETEKLFDLIDRHPSHFVFAGDLNALPDSPTVRGLEERLVPAGPDYRQPTWTTKPFAYNGFEADELNWRLDYVFASPDLKRVSSEIIATDYSDHLPVLVTFEVA